MGENEEEKPNVKIVKEKTEKKYLMENPSLEKLLNDNKLEEIAVNGPEEPVFVFHRDHGRCETNLEMKEKDIFDFIVDVTEKSTNYINKSKPFLDSKLSDGSRLNATIPPATPKGPTITISKFRERAFSIIDLIENGTLSSEAAAFLWTAVEGEINYPLNILIIGGTGAGKTTTLNTLMNFVPRRERIACIEDTLELNFFGRDNLVRMATVPPTKSNKPIEMKDLLVNALRMRPDKIVVGEVRGEEAKTLFNAMNVGHSAIGTLHANSTKELKSRLTNPPMSVPRNMLSLIDIVVVQKKIIKNGEIRRRISSITEVSRSEVGASFNDLFIYDESKDKIERTDTPSRKLERIANLSESSFRDIQNQIDDKRRFLEKLLEKDIKRLEKTDEKIQDYYSVKYMDSDKKVKINN